MVRQSLEELMSDEPVDMRLESMGHLRLADEQADLNISLLGGFGEVGRTDEGGVAVDDHALGMQARSGTLALGQSTKTGTFLRVDRPLPAYADAMGVRAEIEVTRSGPLAAIDQVENPFAKFCLYQFPPHISQGRFGCFIPASARRG